jgi:hypothetical protein
MRCNTLTWEGKMEMRMQVLEVSTDVFRVLQKRAPAYVSLSDEGPGPSQLIVVDDDVYSEIIDRAIAKRQSLDQVVREICCRNCAVLAS